jgi:DNA invertase Pin-like site-specific DNA recombinase
MIRAVAYMRTSSGANVGDDKDSVPRQRAAIDTYAASAGYEIASSDYFYDPKIKGEHDVAERPGFAAMLTRLETGGIQTIIVETANRFARDLMVQEVGFARLSAQGITLIAADSPGAFLDNGPTSTLIRQILGAVAQFEKAALVAKLRAARMRKKKKTGKCGGRKSLAELRPDVVELARKLKARDAMRSYGDISRELAALGHLTPSGKPYARAAVKAML